MKKTLIIVACMILVCVPGKTLAGVTLSTDFNSGPLNQNIYNDTNSCVTSQDPNDPTNNVGYLSTDYSVDGGKSFRAQVRKTDPKCGNGYRTEMHLSVTKQAMASATWVAWDTLQPASQPDDVNAFSSGQMHGKVNVPFSVWFQGAGAKFVIQNSNVGAALTTNKIYDLGTVKKGQWHRWIVNFKRSSGADGYMNLWLDGVQRVAYTGPTADIVNGVPELNYWYFKFGIYKWGIQNATALSPAVSYVDNIKFGDSTATLSDFLLSPNIGTTVDTTAPNVSLTSPIPGSVLGTVALAATATDNVAVSKVDFYQGTTLISSDTVAPYTASWNTTTVANGSYSIKAIATDSSNNTKTSSLLSVTVNNLDITAPTIALTSPSAGTVNGTITLAATAADNIGVARVDFFAGGAPIGSDTTAPYSVTWNTVNSPNIAFMVKAIAYDAAGNAATSNTLSVMVFNVAVDTTAPTVSITSPSTGVTLSGTTTLSANASDNVAVSKVDFYSGSSLIGTDITSPYSISWSTKPFVNGPYVLTAIATDISGNSKTSNTVNIIVSNSVSGTPTVTTPSAPTNVIAIPGYTRVKIRWSNPTSNGGSSVTSYVMKAIQNGRTVLSTVSPGMFTSLSNGAPYTFTVQAVNSAGAGTAATTTTVTPSATYTVGGQVLVNVSNTLTVRRTASNGGTKIGTVPNGSVGTVLQNGNGWTKIQFPTITGWVSSIYIFPNI